MKNKIIVNDIYITLGKEQENPHQKYFDQANRACSSSI